MLPFKRIPRIASIALVIGNQRVIVRIQIGCPSSGQTMPAVEREGIRSVAIDWLLVTAEK